MEARPPCASSLLRLSRCSYQHHRILFSCRDRFILDQGFRLDLESKLGWRGGWGGVGVGERDYVILDFVLILFFCLELGELAVFLFMGMGGKSFVIAEFQIACISSNMAPWSPFDKHRRLLSDQKSTTLRPEGQSDVNW